MAEKPEIKIFVASSAEVNAEREKVILAVHALGNIHKHLLLRPVLWEYDVIKGSTHEDGSAQGAINPKLMESHMAVFIFYSKIGKYTGVEFELANEKKIKFFAYFKKGYELDIDTHEAYGELLKFKKLLNEPGSEGLVGESWQLFES